MWGETVSAPPCPTAPWCPIPTPHSPTTLAELLAALDSLDRRADALVSDAGRVARVTRKAVRAARISLADLSSDVPLLVADPAGAGAAR